MQELNVIKLAEQCLNDIEHKKSLLRNLTEKQVRQVEEAIKILRQDTPNSMEEDNANAALCNKTYSIRELLTLDRVELQHALDGGVSNTYMVQKAIILYEQREILEELEAEYETLVLNEEDARLTLGEYMNLHKSKTNDEIQDLLSNTKNGQTLQYEALTWLLIYPQDERQEKDFTGYYII